MRSIAYNETVVIVTVQTDKTVNPHVCGRGRTKQDALVQIGNIQQQGTESGKKECRTKYGLKETHNPLFSLSVDLYM
jgi:hypothetical protein